MYPGALAADVATLRDDVVGIDGNLTTAAMAKALEELRPRRRGVDLLAKSLADHQRAVLLVCCIYDNPGFDVDDGLLRAPREELSPWPWSGWRSGARSLPGGRQSLWLTASSRGASLCPWTRRPRVSLWSTAVS